MATEVGPDGCYVDRKAYWHKWMGPPSVCPDGKCGGKGCYEDGSPTERYCDCPAGDLRKRLEAE